MNADDSTDDFDEVELAADLEPLGDEIADAALAFEERLDGDGELAGSQEVAIADNALAVRLCDALAGRADQIWALEEHFDAPVGEWLANVPFDLAHHGMVDASLALLTRLEDLMGPGEVLGDRAMILARSHRADEAKKVLATLLSAHPDDAEVHDRACDVLEELGETADAERHARRVVELSETDPFFQLHARERLVRLLRARGASSEADELEEEVESMREELEEAQNPSVRPPSH